MFWRMVTRACALSISRATRRLIRQRLARRRGHYMPATLLDSQFAALEPPSDAITVDVAGTPEAIAAAIVDELGQPR